eukprot:TRINITY_DN13303_c3_g1_i1.p2 TRINITY_DN13303_c3_g1~~TRINITY_DN13303_c3_g1_i1.p2  ORF type:complete len:120 (+),score=3.64 TRINITY_DN13303_c3_g1_i1:35-361(+)
MGANVPPVLFFPPPSFLPFFSFPSLLLFFFFFSFMLNLPGAHAFFSFFFFPFFFLFFFYSDPLRFPLRVLVYTIFVSPPYTVSSFWARFVAAQKRMVFLFFVRKKGVE